MPEGLTKFCKLLAESRRLHSTPRVLVARVLQIQFLLPPGSDCEDLLNPCFVLGPGFLSYILRDATDFSPEPR